MASLRRKPADVAVASVDTAQPVNVGIDSNPPPPPAPITPPNDASEALKHQLEALRQSEGLQEVHQQQQQAIATAEGRRHEWLQGNPLAQKHYAHLGAFHNEAIQAGLIDTSPDYFQHMESCLAALHSQQPATAGAHLIDEMQARTAQERAPEPPPLRQRTNIVSAPVSREIPGASGGRESGKITLSNEQKEYARIAGVSEVEYAKQLLRLNGMKASGEYSDRR